MKIIYLISDPRPGDLRCYVGQTSRPLSARLAEHLAGGTVQDRNIWLEDICSIGLSPEVDVIELVEDDAKANGVEQEWIRRFAMSPCHILMNGPSEVAIHVARDLFALIPHAGRKRGWFACVDSWRKVRSKRAGEIEYPVKKTFRVTDHDYDAYVAAHNSMVIAILVAVRPEWIGFRQVGSPLIPFPAKFTPDLVRMCVDE